MIIRPAIGEFVVFGSGIDEPVYFVKAHAKSSSKSVLIYCCSGLQPAPAKWVFYNRLRYLSQTQSQIFFRGE